MGADGGFSYTKVKDFRDNWKEIKASLLEGCEPNSWHDRFDIEWLDELKAATEKMPDNLETMSNSDIIEMLKEFKNCDCPCIIEGLLITGYGNNVPINMHILDLALYNFSNSVETWT
jgi:hypothetical protein